MAASEETHEIKHDSYVEMMVQVDSAKSHRTKSGAEMCFVTVSDKTGSCEVIVFAELYSAVRDLLRPGNAVHFIGKATVREGEGAKLIAELAEPGERFLFGCGGRGLCVKADSEDKEMLGEIRRIALKHRSTQGSRFTLFMSDKRTAVSIKEAPFVKLSAELIRELQQAAGTQSVMFMKRKETGR